MASETITSTGVKAGISFSLWKRHKLTQETPSKFKDDNIAREESGEFLNWTAQLFTQTLDQAPYKWDSFSDEQTTEICTFFPDHLITLVCSKKPFMPFTGYVVFADVSGFTPLCEKYAAFGPSGAYHLTATLNSYIGKMVSLIYSYGGDLIKFAGDAFVAVWEFHHTDEIFVGMHKVITCAMEIQTSLGHFQTDVGVFLRVKLAISVGSFIFTTIGSKQNASYIIYGLPILEVKEGERLCSSGDTVLSPAAWSLLDPVNYVYEVIKGGFVKVKEIIFDPTRCRQLLPQAKKKNRFSLLFKPWKLRERYIQLVKEEMGRESFIRPIILNPELKQHADILRRFVIAPIVHQIQKGSSVEYLIEMRQVTIMFINIIPKDIAATKITVLVNEVHRTVSKIIEKKLGVINKICLFDKDIMVLVLFGLKGYKGKDEALRTLQSGALVIEAVSKFENVKSVSVGATVGTTYCGVVGHPQRKEYTVIGGAVNRAARLMCTFKNVVSCDLAVVFNSRLSFGYFERATPVYLKGIGIVSNIFIYLGSGDNTIKMPLLGRYNIICKFVDMMAKNTPYQCLILRGEPRVGRTRVLQEFQDIAEQWNWSSLMISVNQMISPDICLIHKLIASFIGKQIKDRVRFLLDEALEEDLIHLHLLNKIFDVNFPVPLNYKHLLLPEDEDNFYKRILRKVLCDAVIIIDDAEDLDSQSWKALCNLINIPDFVVVFAVPKSYDIQDIYARELINNPLSLSINIECLPDKYLGPLVCQMLSADAVSFKLIRLLKKISHGNPGWIQTFLLSYVESGTIIVHIERSDKVSKKLYLLSDPTLIRGDVSFSFKKNSIETDLQVCEFMDEKIEENEVPPTFDDVIMATFDKLTPFEQLLLKCGAVLGKEFKRYVLIYMMDFPSDSAVCEAVEVLFKMDILGCANVKHTKKFTLDSSAYSEPIAECNCDTIPLSRLSFPKYAFCEFLSFKFSILASTIYQIIPLNQRLQFHTRALSSIKEQIMRCSECVHQEILITIEKRIDSSRNDSLQTESNMANIRVTLEQLHRSDRYKEVKKKRSFSARRAAIITVDEKLRSSAKSLTRRYGKPEAQFKLELNALKEMAEKRQESMYVKIKRSFTEDSIRSSLKDIFRPSFAEDTEDTFQMYAGDILNIIRVSEVLHSSHKSRKRNLTDFEFFKPYVVNCTCYYTGIDIYDKLIYHSKSAELRITELKYLVECAIHHTKYCRYESALKLLLEARNLYNACMALLVKSKAGSKLAEGNDLLTLKDLQFEKKKIHCYLGKCYLSIGELQKCLQELNEVTSEGYLFGLDVLVGKCLLKTLKFNREFVGKKRTEIALLSFVYVVLADLYLMMFLFREAAYTAKIAINYALAIKQLQFMANAYAANIDAYLMIGKLRRSKKAEEKALNVCLEVYTEKNIWDLLSLGKVFLAIFKGRVHRGELLKALEIGEALINISESFKALDVLAYVYPVIIMVLGNLHRLERIKEILLKLQEPTEEIQYEYGLREHLDMRMNLYLLVELGYCMMPPNMLINKLRRYVNPNMIPVDRIVCRRIAIYLWVWYLRRKDFNNAKIWQIEPYDNVDLCYENIPGTLVMLQGKLMWIAHIMQSGRKLDTSITEQVIRRIKKLEWICKNRIPVFLARLFHLKAYKKILWSSISSTFNPGRAIPGLRELNKALKFAKKHENHHEIAWIQHSINVWYSFEMPSLLSEVHRKNHYNYENVEHENIIKYEHDDILYDLPLPRKAKRRLINVILLTGYEYGSWRGKLVRRILGLFNKNERITITKFYHMSIPSTTPVNTEHTIADKILNLFTLRKETK